jgi:hypothetical protein
MLLMAACGRQELAVTPHQSPSYDALRKSIVETQIRLSCGHAFDCHETFHEIRRSILSCFIGGDYNCEHVMRKLVVGVFEIP